MKDIMKKLGICSFVFIVIFMTSFIYKQTKKDFVPDAETAKKIAETIWLPIYGKNIFKEKPYNAALNGDIWIVTGTLADSSEGGVAYIEIQKSDCKILNVTHGK